MRPGIGTQVPHRCLDLLSVEACSFSGPMNISSVLQSETALTGTEEAPTTVVWCLAHSSGSWEIQVQNQCLSHPMWIL